MTGRKFDQEKDRWDLLPLDVIVGVVKVLTYGAKKYEPNNWKKVPNAKERYYAAMMRHLTAYRLGEGLDPESQMPHLWHALTNLIFLTWFEINWMRRKDK